MGPVPARRVCVARRASAWLLWTALGTLALAAAAPAQQAVTFDPAKHLEGFDTARFGIDNDLWQFAEFEALEGKAISTADLDLVRKKWGAERERVAAELGRLTIDPGARTRRLVFKRLNAHPYFSKLELVEYADYPPILYLVHKPGKVAANFEKAAASTSGRWLVQAVATFEREFAPVLPATRRDDHAIYPLLLLASNGDLANAWGAVKINANNGSGFYEADLRLAVTHTELLGAARDDATERTATLFALAHSIVASYAAAPSVPPKHFWLAEGIARFLSRNGGDAAAPKVAEPDERGIRWLCERLKEPAARDLFFLSVDEILQVTNQQDLFARMGRRRGHDSVDSDAWGHSVRAIWQIECGLLVWLHLRDEGGRRRNTLLAVAADLFGTTVKLKDAGIPALAVLDPKALQKELIAFIDREGAKLDPKLAFEPALRAELEQWTSRSGAGAVAGGVKTGPADPASAEGGGSATSPGGAGSLVDPAFKPSALLDTPFPPETQIGLALRKGLFGRLDAAADDLDAIKKEQPPHEALALRCEREAARLRALARLRRDFVERCAAEKKKLKIEEAGTTQFGTVQAVEAEEVLLVDAKSRTLKVPLAQLDIDELLRRMTELKLDVGTAPERAFAQLLAGRKTWSKGLAAGDPVQAALLTDGKETPLWLKSANAASLLVELARAELPKDARTAESRLADVKGLLADFGGEPIVTARREGLRQIAAATLMQLIATKGLAQSGLRAKVEPLAEGRSRVTWDFQSAEQAEDWYAVPYPKQEEKSFQLETPPKDYSIRIADGAVHARGIQCWRSRIEFEAPMKLFYRVSYRDPDPASDAVPFGSLCLSLCDDGRTNRIISMEMAGLRSYDGRNYKQHYTNTPYTYGEVYEITLVHDGQTATLTCPGFPDRSVPVWNRKRGLVGIHAFSDVDAVLLDLTIEGRVTPESIAALGTQWAEKELAKLFGG